MPELLQGFLIGIVLAIAAGALVLYLQRGDAAARPPGEDHPGPGDRDRTTPEEGRR